MSWWTYQLRFFLEWHLGEFHHVKKHCISYTTKSLIFCKSLLFFQNKAWSSDSLYRYMYLKTYAKFTFCIKSPGHVSDENFLYYCMHLASKISSFGVWNLWDKKTHFYLLFKFSIFFDMYLKTYRDIFSHIFKMVTARALRQLLLFIALDYLTSAAFIANLCSHLIPVHYKTSTTCTSKRTF